MKKPWYKSLKKVIGVIFMGAVLIGGILGIMKEPDNTVRILELWAITGGTLLGITMVGGVAHKVVDKPAGK